MNQPNIKSPSAEEAEAALLALGPQIEWRDGCDGADSLSGYVKGDRLYAIMHNQNLRTRPFIINARRNAAAPWRTAAVDKQRLQIEQCDSAKAICERHYATGRWKPRPKLS